MTEPAEPTNPTPTEPPPPPPPTWNATGGWRRPRDRDRGNHFASTIVGVILILVGTWYFLDRTLGIQLPRIAWSQLWPVLLIVIGVLVLLRASGRRA